MPQSYLFIAGAPRSGTTFLTHALEQHPDIQVSKDGASYYFMDDGHPLLNAKHNYHTGGLKGFSSVFANNEVQYHLDGTDHLMYQLSMVNVIKDIRSKKIIFIFRNPADRIYSSFMYTKNNLGNIKEGVSFRDYTEALINDDKKKILGWTPSGKRSGYVLARELEYSNYCHYVSVWLEKIAREDFIFLRFDDLKNNKEGLFEKLFESIGLSSIRVNEDSKNESYEIKNKKLHQKIMNLSQGIPSGKFKNLVKNTYLFFQKDKIEYNEGDKESIQKLNNFFIDSNKKLKELVGVEL